MGQDIMSVKSWEPLYFLLVSQGEETLKEPNY